MAEKIKRIFRTDPYNYSFKDFIATLVIVGFLAIVAYGVYKKNEFAINAAIAMISLPQIVLFGYFAQEGSQTVMDKWAKIKSITQSTIITTPSTAEEKTEQAEDTGTDA
jgi:uncharacterized membrane protein